MRARRLLLFIVCLTAPCAAALAGSTLRVASLMIVPVKWDKEANAKRLDEAIRKAKAKGAELIVTPEGALEGYVVNEVIRATGEQRQKLTERFNALAEPCDGPYVQRFQKLCKELRVSLVLGFLEADAGKTYNTAVLVRPDGTIAGKYRKTHFAQGYSNSNEKGDNPPGYLRGTAYPVFEIAGRKMGIMICYDRREPVVARKLVANGAEFIINPAYGMKGDCNCEFLATRAKETHVPILFVHPEQTVYTNARGEITTDLRPNPNEPRVAIVDMKIPNPTALAARYEGDKNIEGNRDVVAFVDFESDDWRKDWSGGQRATVSVVREDAERGFEPLLGKALRIKVAKGGHYGASLQYRFKDRTGSEPEEIYFRYYLRLGSDWDPARGGKIPGIGGTYGRAGWGGRPSNGRNGRSARGQFNGRKDGKTPIGFYCYHADMKGRYGSGWIWDKDGLGYLENNRWYCIEQHVRMNTPGKNDGVLEGWVDGKLAFRKTDVRMRDVPELKIECIWINVYHGGKWSAESDDHLYIDNVVIARRNIGPIEPPTGEN
jgi:predicted amidohydrolase